MNVTTIFLHEGTDFSKAIQTWATDHNVTCENYTAKGEDNFEKVDGLVWFHENHNFESNDQVLRDTFDKHAKPIHKIDINGTLAVTLSHYNLWIERHNIKKILIIGNNNVAKNINLERYLTNLKGM
jgi:hypothetical protein